MFRSPKAIAVELALAMALMASLVDGIEGPAHIADPVMETEMVSQDGNGDVEDASDPLKAEGSLEQGMGQEVQAPTHAADPVMETHKVSQDEIGEVEDACDLFEAE